PWSDTGVQRRTTSGFRASWQAHQNVDNSVRGRHHALEEAALNEFQQYIAEEYVDHYKEGEISRRGMLRRVAYLTGGAVMAVGFLRGLGIDVTADEVLAAGPDATPASEGNAVTVQPDDPAIRAGWIIYQGMDGAPLIGYLAR